MSFVLTSCVSECMGLEDKEVGTFWSTYYTKDFEGKSVRCVKHVRDLDQHAKFKQT